MARAVVCDTTGAGSMPAPLIATTARPEYRMPQVLSIDFETRATVDLRKSGVYPYAMHPDTDIWVMAYAFDEEDVDVWHPGEPLPARVAAHVEAGGEIRAWNAQFEKVIWREIMVPRYNAPPVRPEQWVDTAAEAAAMALPRSLDQAANVLGIKQKKDSEGYGLMMRMTKPRRIDPDGTIIWWHDPARLERLDEYCRQDVRVERAAKKALRPLNPLERRIYLLDQAINDRGVHIDVPLVQAAIRIVDEGMARANITIDEITGGAVTTITNHNALAGWLTLEGVENEGVSKPALKELLESDLDPKIRKALELRAQAGRTSVAKLGSMLNVIAADWRARGLTLYHAASTGRWGGKLIQPQNFPRGEVKNVEEFIDMVQANAYDLIDQFAHPIVVVLSMLRAMLIAKPGYDLIAGDFSAVEARVVNWLAGQDDVLDLFRAYDAGDKTKDPYKVMAVKMGRAKTTADVTVQDRQAGKAAELGCGFGMGHDKFVTAAWDVYQVRVTLEEAKSAVDIYRKSHARVKQLWYDAENAAIEATQNPGRVVIFGGRKNLKAIVAGSYLYLVLPSGRALAYAAPRVQPGKTPWGEEKDQLTYMGVHPKTNQWVRMSTYGGHLTENLVQAVARDLLAEAMLRLEEAQYPIVLHAHDEAVAEVAKGIGSLKEYESIMAASPAWADGLPILVEGWRGERYRK